jgi:hypothetical protein
MSRALVHWYLSSKMSRTYSRLYARPEAPTSQRSSVVIASKWDLVVPSSRLWKSGSLARSSSRTSTRVGSVTNTGSGSRTMPAT